MNKPRCAWPLSDPLYISYHDDEWGVPEYDDRALFEKLILDGFQAGLSWITILRKRENFRLAFDGFEPSRIALYTDADVERLMSDAGIVRNRAKILATIGNAQSWLEIMEGGSFSEYLWDFVDDRPIQNSFESLADLPAETELSRIISKDLKSKDFKFCGPTIIYAFMQAVGMVNDHIISCYRHGECAELAGAGNNG